MRLSCHELATREKLTTCKQLVHLHHAVNALAEMLLIWCVCVCVCGGGISKALEEWVGRGEGMYQEP